MLLRDSSSLVTLAVLVVLASPAVGLEIQVAPDGSGDVPNIQVALDTASSGDTIVLADGVFTGPGNRDLVVDHANLIIRSAGGDPLFCVIDLEGHRGLVRSAGVLLALAGFTLRNGHNPENGGAVQLTHGRIDLSHCHFEANTTGGRGGAVSLQPALTSVITDCHFTGNLSYVEGAALYAGCSLDMARCTFADNQGRATVSLHAFSPVSVVADCSFLNNATADGILYLSNSRAQVVRCLFAGNDTNDFHGSLRVRDTLAEIADCTFVDNGGLAGGDIDILASADAYHSTIRRCLLAFGRAPYAILAQLANPPLIECTDIFTAGAGWPLAVADQAGNNGNLDANPLFCDLAGGDLQLADISPCLPANNSCHVQIGRDGLGCISGGFVVYPDGHGLLGNIQAAIDAVPSGGEVLLADGVFAGEGNRDLDFHGKALTLRSLAGNPDTCVIAAGGIARGFVFHSLEGSASVVRGITVRGGWSDGAGGAVLVEQASPWFEDCRFESSTAVWGGGMAATADAWPVLRRCVFHGNQALLGAAISLQGARLDAYSCTLVANHSVGTTVFVQDGIMRCEQSLIAHNTGGLAAWIMPGADIHLTACDFFGNEGGDWTEPFAEQLDLQDNFLAPPCFCDLEGEMFTLCADSWCLPENNPLGNGLLVGALGAGCDACDCGGPVSNEDDPSDETVVPPLAGTAITAYPNPFNPATTITYRLDRAGAARVAVFDLRGHLVSSLLQAGLPAGEGRVLWSGRDDQGRAVEAGTYLCRLDCAGGIRTVAVTLVK